MEDSWSPKPKQSWGKDPLIEMECQLQGIKLAGLYVLWELPIPCEEPRPKGVWKADNCLGNRLGSWRRGISHFSTGTAWSDGVSLCCVWPGSECSQVLASICSPHHNCSDSSRGPARMGTGGVHTARHGTPCSRAVCYRGSARQHGALCRDSRAPLVTSKNTRETGVSQGIWLVDFTETDWFPALPTEPFQGLTVTG